MEHFFYMAHIDLHTYNMSLLLLYNVYTILSKVYTSNDKNLMFYKTISLLSLQFLYRSAVSDAFPNVL